MKSAQEIIEISSDEEEGIGLKIPEETRAHSCGKRKRKYGVGSELPPGAPLDVPEDDDCLILDGVPESVASGSEYAELGAEMLDEMLIVGEKGQFACRDYPHPRYLCATFLFSMTPHKKHCDMCHCYVCDCPAPCNYWTKHCSATHKEQSWTVERHLFRRRRREQHNLHQHVDVKPASIGVRRPVSKITQSLSSDDKAKSTWHHDPLHLFHVKPVAAAAERNRLLSKSSSSLPPNEPKPVNQDPRQQTQTTRCQEPPHRSIEAAGSRPKDILFEIYKNCPAVISCRRRIPPCLQPDELSDADQDD